MSKFGFVAVLGKANAGKSTLVNSMVGEKVSIVSWKPQTTRNNIKGILTGEDHQIVFVDTPGIHNAKNSLSRFMMRSVEAAADNVDLVLYVVNGEKYLTFEEVKSINDLCKKYKVIVVTNKQDAADKEKLMANLAKLNEVENAVDFITVSALKKINLDTLLKLILNNLEDGEPLYDEDTYTDSSMRFMAAEIIREKALKNLDEEVPHGIGVDIVEFKEREDGITEINADLYCEKDAHKVIIIGKGGQTLKKISTQARLEMERLFDAKIYLQIWVRVKQNWRASDLNTALLGYNKKIFEDKK